MPDKKVVKKVAGSRGSSPKQNNFKDSQRTIRTNLLAAFDINKVLNAFDSLFAVIEAQQHQIDALSGKMDLLGEISTKFPQLMAKLKELEDSDGSGAPLAIKDDEDDDEDDDETSEASAVDEEEIIGGAIDDEAVENRVGVQYHGLKTKKIRLASSGHDSDSENNDDGDGSGSESSGSQSGSDSDRDDKKTVSEEEAAAAALAEGGVTTDDGEVGPDGTEVGKGRGRMSRKSTAGQGEEGEGNEDGDNAAGASKRSSLSTLGVENDAEGGHGDGEGGKGHRKHHSRGHHHGHSKDHGSSSGHKHHRSRHHRGSDGEGYDDDEGLDEDGREDDQGGGSLDDSLFSSPNRPKKGKKKPKRSSLGSLDETRSGSGAYNGSEPGTPVEDEQDGSQAGGGSKLKGKRGRIRRRSQEGASDSVDGDNFLGEDYLADDKSFSSLGSGGSGDGGGMGKDKKKKKKKKVGASSKGKDKEGAALSGDGGSSKDKIATDLLRFDAEHFKLMAMRIHDLESTIKGMASRIDAHRRALEIIPARIKAALPQDFKETFKGVAEMKSTVDGHGGMEPLFESVKHLQEAQSKGSQTKVDSLEDGVRRVSVGGSSGMPTSDNATSAATIADDGMMGGGGGGPNNRQPMRLERNGQVPAGYVESIRDQMRPIDDITKANASDLAQLRNHVLQMQAEIAFRSDLRNMLNFGDEGKTPSDPLAIKLRSLILNTASSVQQSTSVTLEELDRVAKAGQQNTDLMIAKVTEDFRNHLEKTKFETKNNLKEEGEKLSKMNAEVVELRAKLRYLETFLKSKIGGTGAPGEEGPLAGGAAWKPELAQISETVKRLNKDQMHALSKFMSDINKLQEAIDHKPNESKVQEMVENIDATFKRQLGENVVGLKLSVGQVLKLVQQKATKEEVLALVAESIDTLETTLTSKVEEDDSIAGAVKCISCGTGYYNHRPYMPNQPLPVTTTLTTTVTQQRGRTRSFSGNSTTRRDSINVHVDPSQLHPQLLYPNYHNGSGNGNDADGGSSLAGGGRSLNSMTTADSLRRKETDELLLVLNRNAGLKPLSRTVPPQDSVDNPYPRNGGGGSSSTNRKKGELPPEPLYRKARLAQHLKELVKVPNSAGAGGRREKGVWHMEGEYNDDQSSATSSVKKIRNALTTSIPTTSVGGGGSNQRGSLGSLGSVTTGGGGVYQHIEPDHQNSSGGQREVKSMHSATTPLPLPSPIKSSSSTAASGNKLLTLK